MLHLSDLKPGDTLDRYELLQPVARGGMAAVWAARLQGSRGFQQLFAIKTMLPGMVDDPDFEAMFLDEARLASQIRHPFVVQIFDLGEVNDWFYLVMEWVNGETIFALNKAAKASGGIPLPILMRIVSDACAGLHSAHELRDSTGKLVDLVHRDISPQNVMVSFDGIVKIVDFGVAKATGRTHETRVSGLMKGKVPYLSPEQIMSGRVDRRSDIFALGILMYVMLSGRHPFRGDSDTKTMDNICTRLPVPLKQLLPGILPELEAIVMKALEKDPRNRWPDCAELQRAIDGVRVSLGVTVTDGDVAKFVRSVLGPTITERNQKITSAIAAADERMAARRADAAAKGEQSARFSQPARTTPEASPRASRTNEAAAPDAPRASRTNEASPEASRGGARAPEPTPQPAARSSRTNEATPHPSRRPPPPPPRAGQPEVAARPAATGDKPVAPASVPSKAGPPAMPDVGKVSGHPGVPRSPATLKSEVAVEASAVAAAAAAAKPPPREGSRPGLGAPGGARKPLVKPGLSTRELDATPEPKAIADKARGALAANASSDADLREIAQIGRPAGVAMGAPTIQPAIVPPKRKSRTDVFAYLSIFVLAALLGSAFLIKAGRMPGVDAKSLPPWLGFLAPSAKPGAAPRPDPAAMPSTPPTGAASTAATTTTATATATATATDGTAGADATAAPSAQ